MSESIACVDCLRRSWLLAALSPYMERHVAGDADEALRLVGLGDVELARAVAPKVARHALAQVVSYDEVWFRARLDHAACWAVCRHSDLFPKGVLQAECPPPALFGRGSLALLSRSPDTMVTIVGAEITTGDGRRAARDLARECAGVGLTVVGDMQDPVAAWVHRAALEVGHTIAVLACGPDLDIGPHRHNLQKKVVGKGAVVSELPPGTPVSRWALAARERILASISQMTVLVEPIVPPTRASAVGLAGWLGREVGAVSAPLCQEPAGGAVAELTQGCAREVESGSDVLAAVFEL
jgi:DNA processing protein